MNVRGAPVVVVGAGFAGLTAAIRVAGTGRPVLVLERSPDRLYPCNSRIATGAFHVALQSPAADPALLAARIAETVGDAARPDLVQAMAGDALRAARWLASECGARFIRTGDDPGYQFVLDPPTGEPSERGAARLLRAMERSLIGHGGELRRGHRVLRLRMHDAACIGISGVTADGTTFELPARAVVIADGGFQANLDRLRGVVSPAPERLAQRNARTGLGDGLRMAEDAGAAITDLAPFYGHLQSLNALTDDRFWPYPWADELAQAAIVVGRDGRRFADESRGGVWLANRIARLPDPAGTCLVCDQPAWEGPGAARQLSLNPRLLELGGTLHRSDSIAGLARLAGIDADGLAAEIARFNASIEREALPGRWPIRTVPFYAIPICAGITYTMGGVAIDADSRVLRPDGTPIEGLYAAGSATGGLEGGERAGYVGGFAKSVVTGLRAAEHLAGAA